MAQLAIWAGNVHPDRWTIAEWLPDIRWSMLLTTESFKLWIFPTHRHSHFICYSLLLRIFSVRGASYRFCTTLLAETRNYLAQASRGRRADIDISRGFTLPVGYHMVRRH